MWGCMPPLTWSWCRKCRSNSSCCSQENSEEHFGVNNKELMVRCYCPCERCAMERDIYGFDNWHENPSYQREPEYNDERYEEPSQPILIPIRGTKEVLSCQTSETGSYNMARSKSESLNGMAATYNDCFFPEADSSSEEFNQSLSDHGESSSFNAFRSPTPSPTSLEVAAIQFPYRHHPSLPSGAFFRPIESNRQPDRQDGKIGPKADVSPIRVPCFKPPKRDGSEGSSSGQQSSHASR